MPHTTPHTIAHNTNKLPDITPKVNPGQVNYIHTIKHEFIPVVLHFSLQQASTALAFTHVYVILLFHYYIMPATTSSTKNAKRKSTNDDNNNDDEPNTKQMPPRVSKEFMFLNPPIFPQFPQFHSKSYVRWVLHKLCCFHD